MAELEINGIDELTSDLKKACNIYPDKAEQTLRSMGNEFRRTVKKEYEEKTNKYTGRLLKGFKLSKTKGYGSNMYVEFSGTAPHFHLLENGHEKINKKGENVGFFPGYGIVKKNAATYPKIMEKKVDKMVDKILKESNL